MLSHYLAIICKIQNWKYIFKINKLVEKVKLLSSLILTILTISIQFLIQLTLYLLNLLSISINITLQKTVKFHWFLLLKLKMTWVNLLQPFLLRLLIIDNLHLVFQNNFIFLHIQVSFLNFLIFIMKILKSKWIDKKGFLNIK